MSKRPFVFFIAMAIAFAACNRGKPTSTTGAASEPRRITLALDWVPEPEFGGFYEARERGHDRAQGLALHIRGGGAGVPVVQMVAAGQVDFGIAGADEILIARARGVDVVPLFATFQTTPQAIMTPAARGANTLAEVFSGGTLAVEPGLPYVAYLKKKYGFDRVQVVPYDGGVARFAVEKDFAQQCYLTSEPIAARRRGVEPRVFRVADEGFNPYLGVLITRGETLRRNPALVRKLLRAVRDGWRGYLDDPRATDAAMSRLNPAMDPQTFVEAGRAQRPLIEDEGTRAHGLGTMSRARWEALGAELVALGIIDKAPPLDALLPHPAVLSP